MRRYAIVQEQDGFEVVDTLCPWTPDGRGTVRVCVTPAEAEATRDALERMNRQVPA